MKFGSVCSGIEAASVAWHPLGWKAAWLAEIEPFPAAVLAHHYPDVPNIGDMTKLLELIPSGGVEAPDVFCGGTPCQAFSVAGLRKSLDDARGNLSLIFCEIANAIDNVRADRGEPPAIIFWENVPGVLSTKDNAFGCFLAGLAGEDGELVAPGGKWANAGAVYGPKRAVAWRVLDAQYFGVAQRRRRVFVVASARTGFDPVSVLFEFEGVRRDIAPSRQAGEGTAGSAARSVALRGREGGATAELGDEVQNCLRASSGGVAKPVKTQMDGQMVVTHTLRGEGFDASEDGTGRGTPLVPVAFPANLSGTQCASAENIAPAMGAKNPTAVAYTTKLHNTGSNNAGKLFEERATCLDANSPPPALLTAMQVRRLTPVECERLQGFPDDYTAIPKKVVRDDGAGPCAKQVVTATVVAANGTHFVSTNHCDEPQQSCARAGMPTGVGYEICKDVCKQQAHAERNAVALAGKRAIGATLYIEGHTYVCQECRSEITAAGIAEVVIGKPPGTSANGPRYKALGNSWAVPVVRWIGARIQEAVMQPANDNSQRKEAAA